MQDSIKSTESPNGTHDMTQIRFLHLGIFFKESHNFFLVRPWDMLSLNTVQKLPHSKGAIVSMYPIDSVYSMHLTVALRCPA